jgi:hypothetical protein
MAKDDHTIPVQPEHLPLEGDATARLELNPTDGVAGVTMTTSTNATTGMSSSNTATQEYHKYENENENNDPSFTPLELEDLQFTTMNNNLHSNIRTTSYTEEGEGFSRLCWNYTVMGSFMILIMIAIITTTLFLLLRPDYASNDDPFINLRSKTELEDIRQYLIQNQISPEVPLYQLDSIQYKAAFFMTQFLLPYQVTNTNDEQLIAGLWLDTYIVTLLYYSLNGPEWNLDIGFLQPDSPVCDWFIPIRMDDSDGSSFLMPYGASCKSNGDNRRVDAIQIGT